MDFLFDILFWYFIGSLFITVVHLLVHWRMWKLCSEVDTYHENEKLALEMDHGFITPGEYDAKLQGYRTGVAITIIVRIIRLPFELPILLYNLIAVVYGVLIHGVGPDDLVDPDEVAKDLREKRRAKLNQYERKLLLWKEEDNRKGSTTKFVWRSPAPVPH